MYYTDFHMHSNCSPDAYDTMADMAHAAANFGLSEICFTDHCDMLELDLTPIKDFDMDPLKLQYNEALLKHGTDIKIRFGIELSEGLENLALSTKVLDDEMLDFVIGSAHFLPDMGDFYSLEYTDYQQCYGLIERYIDELFRLTDWGAFDVLGHITYPLRYMNGRGGIDIDFSPFSERLEILFKKLIENGKGIELNTSNLKHPGGKTMPPVELLELYRRCGGEIITLGSDAHRTDHVGSGIPHGYDLLGYTGFKYFTVFEKREPKFIKL